MNLISLILFSIVANLDNIPIGISYSIENRKITFKDIFLISFFTTLITFFVMLFGNSIITLFPRKIIMLSGALTLIMIGIYDLTNQIFLQKSVDNINTVNTSNLKTILMLSTNNLAVGLCASITGINYIYSSLFIFIFSMLFLYIGYAISSKIAKLKNINYLSPIILIVLGIIEFLF